MRKLIMLLLLLPFVVLAQINPNDPAYDQMKRDGLLPQAIERTTIPAFIPEIKEFEGSRTEGFFIPLDGSFTQTMGPNDDGSTGIINLPFTFCFYGTDYNQIYINNNGNLSFEYSYSSYSPEGFPSSNYIMIAPFWGDVDTRAQGQIGTGLVWHKLEAGRLTVIYDHVGYFSYQTDKLNTFQVIITDGNDPLIGVGNNVAFAYEDMEWTTGSASGGSNGFGGSPATVGVNRGDGTNFALVGRFDAPGTCYDGPFGDNDCVSYLNYKRYVFDACDDDVVIINPEVPVSNWALYLGILLMVTFVVIRFRRMV
jgi:hypothetical protein